MAEMKDVFTIVKIGEKLSSITFEYELANSR